MGLVKGLKNINDKIERDEAAYQERKENAEKPRARWFGLKDKQTVKVLFLQELDPDSENFSQKNDIGFLAIEHSNPKNFKKKALCTIDDEGVCWACEQHQKDYKAGWKQKNRLYVNVLVDDSEEEPYVAILSQGNGPKSVTPFLLEFATDNGTITDKWYKIKRNGAGLSDTSYMLMPSTASKENVEDYTLFDLDNVVYEVPYAQQEAHYLDGEQPVDDTSVEPELVGAGAGANDTEW